MTWHVPPPSGFRQVVTQPVRPVGAQGPALANVAGGKGGEPFAEHLHHARCDVGRHDRGAPTRRLQAERAGARRDVEKLRAWADGAGQIGRFRRDRRGDAGGGALVDARERLAHVRVIVGRQTSLRPRFFHVWHC